MRFKTLKHKTLPDTFGYIDDLPQDDEFKSSPEFYAWEIGHCEIPVLQPMTATMEMAIEYWGKQERTDGLMEQLNDYEMVEVEVKVI